MSSSKPKPSVSTRFSKNGTKVCLRSPRVEFSQKNLVALYGLLPKTLTLPIYDLTKNCPQYFGWVLLFRSRFKQSKISKLVLQIFPVCLKCIFFHPTAVFNALRTILACNFEKPLLGYVIDTQRHNFIYLCLLYRTMLLALG